MVSIVVPWRPGCPHRERAWKWLKPRYPWPIIEAPGGDPWIKAVVNQAVEACPPGVVIVADADVWTDGLPEAVEAVEAGAPWAIPHQMVHRLTEDGTAAVLAGKDWRAQPVGEKHPGVPGGGYVIAHRDTLIEVPIDPRFIGWGQEDAAWAMALTTIAGPPWRGTADLIHLWHPSQERLSRTRGSVEGWRLKRRYAQAREDPALMRALLEEAHVARHAPEPAMHDHATQ